MRRIFFAESKPNDSVSVRPGDGSLKAYHQVLICCLFICIEKISSRLRTNFVCYYWRSVKSWLWLSKFQRASKHFMSRYFFLIHIVFCCFCFLFVFCVYGGFGPDIYRSHSLSLSHSSLLLVIIRFAFHWSDQQGRKNLGCSLFYQYHIPKTLFAFKIIWFVSSQNYTEIDKAFEMYESTGRISFD